MEHFIMKSVYKASDECKARAREIVKGLSLRQKIGQLNQERLGKDSHDELKEKIRRGEVGSCILALSATAGNDEQNREYVKILNEIQRTAVEESESGIPLIFGRDVIHGHRTVMPIPLAQAASFNPELTREAYRCVAKEATNDGIHWTFSPMMDISRDPRWGRCIEGNGEDPYLGAKMAEAAIRGFQGTDPAATDSIAACAKHYIGYGASEGGRDYNTTEITDYTLRNIYLKPFKAAVDAGVATVMNSFNSIGGESTTSSRYLLTELLKEELGFEGYVVSDWATIDKLLSQGLAEDKAEAAMLAANAGLDMDMVSRGYIENLEKLVEEGKVSEATITEAAERIVYIKLLFGITEHPYCNREELDTEEHIKVAKKCSDEAMVLLKNKNSILPLKKDAKIFAVGPMLYEKRALLGSWTLDFDIDMVKSPLEALREYGANIRIPASPYLWNDAIKWIKLEKCEAAVLFLGESEQVTGETNSLAHIELPEDQRILAKKLHELGVPVVGVMAFGRPIALEEAEEYFDAILYSWHAGTCTAESMVSCLFGDVNPSGKLPMTFPRTTGHIPMYYNCCSGLGMAGKVYYGPVAWSPVYDDGNASPMYPFGYGLSYTEFEYDNIRCDRCEITYDELKSGGKLKVYAEIKNVGASGGAETVQCYVEDVHASMIRPQRELKGFCKKYLECGETAEVCFEIGFDELGFYNGKSVFDVERGKFNIHVGKNSVESEAKIEVRVI